LADLPGLRRDRDGETGGLSAGEPDVQVDTVGLVQGDVVDEADGACAVPLRGVGVGPECGEICCYGTDRSVLEVIGNGAACGLAGAL
jgi:hypothetical protein